MNSFATQLSRRKGWQKIYSSSRLSFDRFGKTCKNEQSLKVSFIQILKLENVNSVHFLSCCSTKDKLDLLIEIYLYVLTLIGWAKRWNNIQRASIALNRRFNEYTLSPWKNTK